MARAEHNYPVNLFHGKPSKDDPGYFYADAEGNQFYRTRDENYQQNPSLRQQWNSAAFAWAHAELHQLLSSPEAVQTMTDDYETAHHRGPNRKTYAKPRYWKFAMLQHQWRTAHPYSDWVSSIPSSSPASVSSPAPTSAPAPQPAPVPDLSSLTEEELTRLIALLTEQLATLQTARK